MAALALARSKQPDVPFILVSGTLGEEQAVDCVLRGATDYLLKQRPDRLVPAVMRALTEAEEHRKRRESEEALAASEVRYRRLFESARDGILILDAETGMIVDVNPFLIELLGVTREVFLGKRVWELGFFKDVVANEANFLELQQKGYVRYENMALEGRDGKRHEVEFISNVYDVDHSRVIQCNIRDISERKRMEEARRQQTEELRTRNAELMRINRASEGRELRMVELKQQINELCRQLGQPPRHPLDFLGARPQTTTAAEVVGPKGASRTEADLSERPDFKANQTNVPRGAPRRAAE
jgi:PAS domain S-box-containing protein